MSPTLNTPLSTVRLLDAGIDEDGKLEAATVTSGQLVQVCCLSRDHTQDK